MNRFSHAVESFAALDLNVEEALEQLAAIPFSIPCWQFDDVAGLEAPDSSLEGGGIAATGNYPGKPRNGDELRQDISLAMRLTPGAKRLNLHACYAERDDSSSDRDAYTADFFRNWMDWSRQEEVALDFNPSCFNHPMADSGFTYASADPAVQEFWINHAVACRHIAAAFADNQNGPCTVNHWVPDGMKDQPADRLGPRLRLQDALNRILDAAPQDERVEDAVECKLFGIGSESYVVGSHEFYLGYAIRRQMLLCLDAGHFHPTETLGDKISATLLHLPGLLLHLSRGVRWDSDHVVTLDDPTRLVMEEIVRGGYLGHIRFGLDYFDASINRIAAAVLGVRSAKKALLLALLQPNSQLKELEAKGDFTARLCLMEQARLLPFGEVWEEFCRRQNCPGEGEWLQEVKDYEQAEFGKREA